MRNNIYNKVAAESKAIAFTIHLLLFTLITSCSQEAVIAPQDTPDALAMMNPDTPVGISAQVESVKGQATTRAIWQREDYAWNEAHQESYYTSAVVLAPGAITMNNYVAGNSQDGYVTLQILGEKFPFYLKDFNLAEGNDRCVTRWTTLGMYVKDGPYYESLLGMARLTAKATTGQPELNYTLHQTGTKLTVKLVDTEGNPIIIIDDAITVKANVQGSMPQYIYTDGTTNSHVINKLQSIKTLEEDKALDADNFHMVSIPGQGGEVYLKQLVDARGDSSKNGQEVSAVVPATPTHDGDDYAPLENSGLTDADVLTITVKDDYEGLTGSQTGGTYKLKLSDVKLSETGNLTALKSGEHYILTVTLKHNTLVSATATVAGWNEMSADVTLQGNDPSFIPPYEYDEDTNTYTIWQDEAIEACLADRATNHPNAAVESGIPTLAVVSGAETDPDAIDNAIDDGKTTFIVVGEHTDDLCTYITNSKAAPGTINLFLADATSIGTDAFAFCSALKSVNSPKVTSIGENAFESCSALTSVNFPKVTSIRNRAFVYCSVLTSVNFPEATFIGLGAFARCDALASVNLPKVVSIGHAAFHYCAFTDVNLPAVTSIDHQLFMDCKNLKSLTLGSVIGEVGQSPFMNVSTWNCDLTLAEGQTVGDPNVDNRTWAGYTWKSITIK